MKQFEYETQATRVIFGSGALGEVGREIQGMNAESALVIASPEQEDLAAQVGAMIGGRCAGTHAEAVQHVPVESVNRAVDKVRSLQVDGLVAVGGGSAIGLAKAIALQTSLGILAIPTTYSGSEMTPIWGITEDGVKQTGKDPVVKPKTVIYDPELTYTLPARFSATSGVNAMAHCAEALYAENANPIISLVAGEGIRALSRSLPRIVRDPQDREARSEAFYGSWLGGTSLGSVGMALHHKLCHVVGGSFNLPHADTHTVILPYAIQYNAGHAPEAMQAMGRALGVDAHEVAGALFDLNKTLEAPTSLAQIGMKEEDVRKAARLAVRNPYYNPRLIDEAAILELLEHAYLGKRPEAGTIV